MFLRVVLLVVLATTVTRAAEPEVYLLERLVVAESDTSLQGVNVDRTSSRTLYADQVPLLLEPDFKPILAGFLHKPITPDSVNRLSAAISDFAKTHDRLITNVTIPNQNVADGTLRFVVNIRRFNRLDFRGNHWFSSKLLQERLGIKPGDEIRLSVLEEAINWTNTNPFRRVKVVINPLADPGKADLLVGVQEMRPWRVAASADNYGNDILGMWHYMASVMAGNLWGLDHQGSYQFVTGNDPKIYQVHVANYRFPLPWRHFLEASASYALVDPLINGVLRQQGKSESASLKYSIPVRSDDSPIEFHAGFDFKRGNNNLEFAGTRYYASTTDTFQFSAGGSLVKRDKRGGWMFGASASFSPGNLNQRNNRQTYEGARLGANPHYVYGAITVQRLLELERGWQFSSRLIAQASSTNLLGSEQLTIGGATSVRGYNTNIFAGDQGFIFNGELYSPNKLHSLEKIRKNLPPLETRFLMFYDAAQVFVKHPQIDPAMSPLASTGFGVRMSVSNNFSVTADYGWQITHIPYVVKEHSRGNIKVVLAF